MLYFEELPIRIQVLFKGTNKPSRQFRESLWYGAIFKAIKSKGINEWIYPFEMINYIKESEKSLSTELKRGDEWLGKKLGSHLSQLHKSWDILETEKVPGFRFLQYRINPKYHKNLIPLIEEVFII